MLLSAPIAPIGFVEMQDTLIPTPHTSLCMRHGKSLRRYYVV